MTARFLFADFDAMPARDCNMTVWMLTDPRARSLYGPAWEEAATTMIGALRRAAGRQPGSPRVSGMIQDVSYARLTQRRGGVSLIEGVADRGVI